MAEALSMEDMLKECESATQDVFERAQDDWLPPPSDYTVKVDDVRFNTWTSKKDQKNYGVVDPKFTILDGEYANRQFGWAMFGNNPVHQQYLKGFAGLLAGEPSPLYVENVRTVSKAGKGKVIHITIGKTNNKKNPDEPYDTIKFNRIVTG